MNPSVRLPESPMNLGVTKEIEIAKRHQHPHQPGNQNAVEPHVFSHETNEEATEGYERKPGGQSVNAINQVDGIGDKDYQKHGKWCTNDIGHLMDAQEAVKAVKVEAASWHQHGCHDLKQEFGLRSQTDEIIDQPHSIDQHQAHEEIERPEAERHFSTTNEIEPEG